MPKPPIDQETYEMLDGRRVKEDFKSRSQSRPKLKKLSEEARGRGYQPLEDADEAFGFRYSVKASKDMRPRAQAQAGAPVRNIEFEMLLQPFSKGNSNDKAAVATTTVKAGEEVATYEMLLEAPNGDFRQPREFIVEGDEIVEAESWWTAFTGCLSNNCASACLTALWACSGTWAAYLWCLVWRCGGCVLKCVGCASCNCGWWCGWAVGCCRN